MQLTSNAALVAIVTTAVLVALAVHSREARSDRDPQAAALPRQQLQSLGETGRGPNSAHVNWYWIPPSAKPPASGLPRLDASGVPAGDLHSRGLSPLVMDHVFTAEEGQQAWANVHAFEHGELLTGQMRLVHQQPSLSSPPPERQVDLDGVLHGVVDEVNILETLHPIAHSHTLLAPT